MSFGSGRLLNYYHGTPDDQHNFWVYPPDHSLPNPPWDTHFPANLFCNNNVFVGQEGILKHYRCMGHFGITQNLDDNIFANKNMIEIDENFI